MKTHSVKNGCLFLFVGMIFAFFLVAVYAVIFIDRGNPFKSLSWIKTNGFVYAEEERCDISFDTVKRKRQRSRKVPRRVTTTIRDYRFKVGDNTHYGSAQSHRYDESDWVRNRIRHKVLDGGGYSTSVWYDASDPSKSTIEEPRLLSVLILLLIPGAFVPFPILFIYLAIGCFLGKDDMDVISTTTEHSNTCNREPNDNSEILDSEENTKNISLGQNNKRIREATKRDKGANCGNCLNRIVTGTWRCPVHCIYVDAHLICHRYKH